jgi:ABC-2 type transport system ATP-binding protein
VIEVHDLTKRFGKTVAVDDLSFAVHPGRVTGFLGPNGAGKSTTMRCILGLDRPQRGTATFDGRPLVASPRALFEVGALLDASYVHPTRKARHHLRALAASNGIPRARVDEVIELVGLSSVATKRVGGFSLGMRQRLGIAGALLGDPGYLLFDEPANGLDPEGILWIRTFLKALAAQGRTVLVSSHLLSEMSLMADELVVIGRGRLIAQAAVGDFVRQAAGSWVFARSPHAPRLGELLGERGHPVTMGEDQQSFTVTGIDAAAVGELAASVGLVLHELTPQQASLEEAFLEVTKEATEYQAGDATDTPAPSRAGPSPADTSWPAPAPPRSEAG